MTKKLITFLTHAQILIDKGHYLRMSLSYKQKNMLICGNIKAVKIRLVCHYIIRSEHLYFKPFNQ